VTIGSRGHWRDKWDYPQPGRERYHSAPLAADGFTQVIVDLTGGGYAV